MMRCYPSCLILEPGSFPFHCVILSEVDQRHLLSCFMKEQVGVGVAGGLRTVWTGWTLLCAIHFLMPNLCALSLAFSHAPDSLHSAQRLCNCPSDRPIYFSPPTSLENTPSVLSLMSRGSSRQAGTCLSSSSSFLATFQGRKWESPLMLVEPALPLTPIPVCVCVVFPSQNSSLESVWRQGSQPQAS